jgi:hypothetical protein
MRTTPNSTKRNPSLMEGTTPCVLDPATHITFNVTTDENHPVVTFSKCLEVRLEDNLGPMVEVPGRSEHESPGTVRLSAPPSAVTQPYRDHDTPNKKRGLTNASQLVERSVPV